MWENKRDIKIVATDKRKNYLVSEPNYHTTKWFSECLLVIEMKTNKQQQQQQQQQQQNKSKNEYANIPRLINIRNK